MSLFDRYIAVDWSAANTARAGKDSIWIADLGPDDAIASANPMTRAEAMALISGKLRTARGRGERVALGFDFAFGYPTGSVRAITGKRGKWDALWAAISHAVKDEADNRSNRFEAAASFNRDIGQPLYWGHPPNHRHVYLTPTRPDHGYLYVREMRIVEARARGAQSVWKLNGAGSVGGQSLLGIPRLQALRAEFPDTAVWPFETRFEMALAPITLIEIYPSLFPLTGTTLPRDREQVEVTVRRFADLDAAGRLGEFLSAPGGLTPDELRSVLEEEGWIAGVGHEALIHSPPVRPRKKTGYLRDPEAIYAKSFATIRGEADLSGLGGDMQEIAVRMIHACGMVDIAPHIRASEDAVEKIEFAILQGAPILCDAEAVRSSIIGKTLHGNELVVTLNDPGVPLLAEQMHTTRSAAAVDLWRDRLAGAVVVIGNAPTALFHLLEMIDAGAPKPAGIIATPVGFVGAEESKAELALDIHGVPFITLLGRRGGSAIAAAALNAIAGGITA